MDYAKLSKCWRETVYGNNITLCGGKDPLHRVFYLHKSNMCAMIRKRTYVLKGVGNLEDTQWAKAYLQQADTIRFYIKELKQQGGE